MKGRRIGVAALSLVVSTTAGISMAAPTQSVTVERNKDATEVYVSFSSPDDPGVSLHRLILHLPRDSRAHFGRFRRCQLARLQALGSAGCPVASRVGGGAVQGSYVGDPVRGSLKLYNGERIGGRRTLLIHTTPDRGPAYVYIAKWRAGASKTNLDIALALITTYQAQPILSNYELSFRKRFLKAPCGGRWRVSGYYMTGAVIKSVTNTSCR